MRSNFGSVRMTAQLQEFLLRALHVLGRECDPRGAHAFRDSSLRSHASVVWQKT